MSKANIRLKCTLLPNSWTICPMASLIAALSMSAGGAGHVEKIMFQTLLWAHVPMSPPWGLCITSVLLLEDLQCQWCRAWTWKLWGPKHHSEQIHSEYVWIHWVFGCLRRQIAWSSWGKDLPLKKKNDTNKLETKDFCTEQRQSYGRKGLTWPELSELLARLWMRHPWCNGFAGECKPVPRLSASSCVTFRIKETCFETDWHSKQSRSIGWEFCCLEKSWAAMWLVYGEIIPDQEKILQHQLPFVNGDFFTNSRVFWTGHFVKNRVVILHKINGFSPWAIFRISISIFLGWQHTNLTDFVKNRVVILHKMAIPIIVPFCEWNYFHKIQLLANCNPIFVKKSMFPFFIILFFPVCFFQPCQAMAPKKRASGSGAGGRAKALKGNPTPSVPPDALRLPHIKLFDQWVYPTSIIYQDWLLIICFPKSLDLRQTNLVDKHLTMDKYLEQRLSNEVWTHKQIKQFKV